jgi:hypothetical protein
MMEAIIALGIDSSRGVRNRTTIMIIVVENRLCNAVPWGVISPTRAIEGIRKKERERDE